MRCSSVMKFVFAIVFVCATAMSAYAQRSETGVVQGTVSDSDGTAIPGATLTLTSPAVGTTTTYTDKDGYYRFATVLPGTYEVKSELEEYQPIVRKDIRAFVGTTLTVNLTMSQTATAEIVVTGETPLIDASTTAMSKTVPNETIENLPKFA